MGIEDLILQRAKQEGLEQGIERGIEKVKAEVVRNLLEKMGLNDEQAADITGVSVAFVTQ